MNDKDMNKLADLIVDKLLIAYIKEQAAWYTTTTGAGIFDVPLSRPKKKKEELETEDELLGELAKLLTQIEYHKQEENYEKCAELQKKADEINDKISKL